MEIEAPAFGSFLYFWALWIVLFHNLLWFYERNSFEFDFYCHFRISHLWAKLIRSNIDYNSLDFQIHSNWSLASLVQMNCIVVWLKGICQCVLVYLYLRVCINSICLLRFDAVNSVGNAKVWMAYANNRIHVYIKK